MDVSSLAPGWEQRYCPACDTSAYRKDAGELKVDASSNSLSGKELSAEEQQRVSELKKRDKEVKAHEAAHIAAGGQYVRGGANYEYETGPDGRKYAVGGEVPIDTAPVHGDPAATVRKMQVVKAAALAPAQPSGADRAIAAKASMEAAKAQAELLEQKKTTASLTGASVDAKRPETIPDGVTPRHPATNTNSSYPFINTSVTPARLDLLA